MPFEIITCQECKEQWTSKMLWGSFEYLLENDKKLSINRELGWCYACNSFRAVEVLPNLDQLRDDLETAKSQIRELNDLSLLQSIFRRQQKRDLDRHLNKLDEIIQLYKFTSRRSAPPKCLHCGSCDIEAGNFRLRGQQKKQLDFEHPGCGGTLVMTWSDYQVRIVLPSYLYDVEGRNISMK